MSKLVDTCPLTALGLTFQTPELSEGSDHAVGLEDHLWCDMSCAAILSSSGRQDLEIQSAQRSRDGDLYEHLNTLEKWFSAYREQRCFVPVCPVG